jgi:uncharacterized protein
MNQSIINKFYDFLMIFLGLMVGALPFICIGVLISVLVGLYIKSDKILKYRSKNPIISHFQALFLGLALPVCECGNIPLAKRLTVVGFKPSEVITFLLSAPILNPLVLITTLEAFNLDKNIAWIRIISGALIALVVGLLFYQNPNQKDLMKEIRLNLKSFDSFSAEVNQVEVNHKSFIDSFREEFFGVFNMLLIGCFLASLFQVFIPREIVNLFGQDPVLSVIAMIGLAFIISICSSIDAFFALSIASSFTLGSIMSFLVFGPMIDLKTIAMLRTIFKTKTILLMSAMVFVLCFILGLSINFFYKLNY